MKRLIILLVASFFWVNVSWAVEAALSDSLVKEAIEKGDKFREDARSQHVRITEEAEQFLKSYTAEAESSNCIIFTPYLAIVDYVRLNGPVFDSMFNEEIKDIWERNYVEFAFLIFGKEYYDLNRFGSVVRYQDSLEVYQGPDTIVWQIRTPIRADCNNFPERFNLKNGAFVYRQGCLHDYYLHRLPFNSKIWFTVIFASGKELTFEFDLSKIK